MAYTDLPPLARIAKEAGQLAKKMRPAIQAEFAQYGKNPANPPANALIEWKEDGSPVSAGDKACHDFICAELAKEPALNKCGILSEEGTKAEMEAAIHINDRIETDPIDGTNTYINDNPKYVGYSVNIGRVVDGVAIEGAVYFPEMGEDKKGELYFTKDGKAYKQVGDEKPQEISVRNRPPGEKTKVAVGYNEQKLEFLNHSNVEQITAPAQYRTCLVAEGKADLTGLNVGAGGGFHTYDIAGAHAV